MKAKTVLFPSLAAALLIVANLHASAQELVPTDSIDDSIQPPPVYLSLLIQMSIPQHEFKQYSKKRGGFRVEAGIPFRKNRSFSFGAELSALFSTPRQDFFKGIDVETETTVINLHPLIRWAPKRAMKVKPYFDFSGGLTAVYTQTTSEIVDMPTFLEEVLFNQEVEVSSVTHKDQSAASLSYSIGAGLRFGKWVSLGVRYQHANPLEYADKDRVRVDNGQLVYESRRIPLDLFVVTLGVSNWGN